MKKDFIDPYLKVVTISNDIIATSDPDKEETGFDPNPGSGDPED